MKSLTIRGLTKKFYLRESKRASFFKSLVAMPELLRGTRELTAIKDLSFDLNEGDVLGILGLNGSGKSTLLRLVGGIYRPTSGSIRIRHDTSLMHLNIGFNPDLTVAENVFLHGALLGLGKDRLEGSFEDIISFAGLEAYVDVKLKALSSGMMTRLGFATTIQADSPILLLDEIFSVGDERFVRKCRKAMEELADGGRTLLLSSHSREIVSSFCNKALVMDSGSQSFFGSADEGCEHYVNML